MFSVFPAPIGGSRGVRGSRSGGEGAHRITSITPSIAHLSDKEAGGDNSVGTPMRDGGRESS